MKKFLLVLLSVVFIISLTAVAENAPTSSDENKKVLIYMDTILEKDEEAGVIHVKHMYPFEVEEGTENPFLFIEGDFIHIFENANRGPNLTRPVILNAEMAAKVAGAVTVVDLAYPEGVLTKVYHDVETNIWIVRFCDWPLVAGSTLTVVMSGEDARILDIWGS